jgi:hypothetical protein
MQNSVFYVSDPLMIVAAKTGFNTEVLIGGQD